MAKCPRGKNSKALARLVVQMLRPFEKHVLSITTDNGSEFSGHKYIAKMLHTKVFFTHSYSSWEKGLVENTNKLIRQFIPNGTDFSSVSDDFILHVQTELNLRPRKLLNFSTPKPLVSKIFFTIARMIQDFVIERNTTIMITNSTMTLFA